MTPEDISKEIMNDIEIEKLFAFNEDKVMFEAIKKFLLVYLGQGIGERGKPLVGNRNYALQLAWNREIPRSNEELGADLRALTRGIQIIESGFKELSNLKRPIKSSEPEINPAL
jgi:hypothetical protein